MDRSTLESLIDELTETLGEAATPAGGMLVVPLNFQGETMDEQINPIVAALVEALPGEHRIHLAARLLCLPAGPMADEAITQFASEVEPIVQRLNQMMCQYQKELQAQHPGCPVDARPVYAAFGFMVTKMLEMAREFHARQSAAFPNDEPAEVPWAVRGPEMHA